MYGGATKEQDEDAASAAVEEMLCPDRNLTGRRNLFGSGKGIQQKTRSGT
jgi:hypothetical protein